MLKHIVVWNIQGAPDEENEAAIDPVKSASETLRGEIPRLIRFEIGVDCSDVDCDCAWRVR